MTSQAPDNYRKLREPANRRSWSAPQVTRIGTHNTATGVNQADFEHSTKYSSFHPTS